MVSATMPATNERVHHRGLARHPVAQARQRVGLTQEALAEKAGISWNTVARIESGRSTSVEVALAISRELGEPVEKLFGEAKR
jgi:DNA-binding XRE family transcriptional regulator